MRLHSKEERHRDWLLELDTLASNDWHAIEQMLPWWTRQDTKEGVHWAWKILVLLVVDLSNNMSENGAETRIRAKLLTDWLNVTINSWRLVQDSETTRSADYHMLGKKQKLCCRGWKNWDYNRKLSTSVLRYLRGQTVIIPPLDKGPSFSFKRC